MTAVVFAFLSTAVVYFTALRIVRRHPIKGTKALAFAAVLGFILGVMTVVDVWLVRRA